MFNFHVYFCCAEPLLPRSTLSSLSHSFLSCSLHFIFCFLALPISSFYTLFPLFYFISFYFVFYLDILISFCHSLRFFFSLFPVRIIPGLRTRYTCVEKIWIIYTQIRRRAESNTTFPPFSFPLFLSYYLLLLSHPFPFYSLPFHDPILCLSPATQLIYPLTFSFCSPPLSLSLSRTHIHPPLFILLFPLSPFLLLSRSSLGSLESTLFIQFPFPFPQLIDPSSSLSHHPHLNLFVFLRVVVVVVVPSTKLLSGLDAPFTTRFHPSRADSSSLFDPFAPCPTLSRVAPGSLSGGSVCAHVKRTWV